MIVKQDYWDKSYSSYEFKILPPNDPTVYLIKKYIPNVKNNEEAFEIGCFPGRFLIELGNKGYILNGCDLTPRVEKDLKNWLIENNYKVGHLDKNNYSFFVKKKYDLVASFGFIEHLENYTEFFLQQSNMVKPGGILIVQYPNFMGFIQNLLHKFLDTDNYNNHVIHSMDLNAYKKILPSDFDLIYCSYYGRFDFWTDDYNNSNKKTKKIILKLIFKSKKLWKFLPNNPIWSPYAAIIAKRRIT